MTDKELLEAAVKAAGFDRWYWEGDSMIVGPATKERFWQPLESDGDALRLAVKCHIDIEWRGDGRVSCFQHLNDEGRCYPNSVESSRENVNVNTRRAIVRAAAAIGAAQ